MITELKVAHILTEHKLTLAIAESCSGGLLSHRLTNISGSSAFFKLGLVTYSNEAKSKLLGIPSKIIHRYGAVSKQVATRMAQAVRRISKADLGIGLTGIAGPSGATVHKPVGLTFIAAANSHETLCLQFHFKGQRLSNKSQAATQALKLILEFLN